MLPHHHHPTRALLVLCMQDPLHAMVRDNVMSLRPWTDLPPDYSGMFRNDKRTMAMAPAPPFLYELRTRSSELAPMASSAAAS